MQIMISPLEIGAVSFISSFVFALGGVGAAVVIIPIFVFLGVPFITARPAGLFVNFISVASISMHNLRSGIVDFKIALPMIITSIIIPPLGAYVSHLISDKIVGIAFALFLFFAGLMIYIPKKEKTHKEAIGLATSLSIGTLAGFISGLLGVGGGGVISPLLFFAGLNPKKVVITTALVVPFSSFTAFIAYWRLGSVNWVLTLSAAIPAVFAGYIAAYISHKYLKPKHVKKLLGIIFFVLALKMLLKFV
jgi:uncharacterized membrane protein YfcA